MKNFVQDGVTLPVTLAVAIASGAGLLVGQLFGVAVKDGAIGETINIQTEGVFDLKYTVAATAAVGDLIYWDDAAKNVTKTASSNKKIGICVQAAASADATMRVKLVPTI
jgi:predicted RecA/RadA family phage recombinase